jgi:hypothetical protein
VAIDRQNIVNRHAGLHWVVAPAAYETGKLPGGPDRAAFYWNPLNLQKCVVNLGRAATALWRILKTQPEQALVEEPWKEGVPP